MGDVAEAVPTPIPWIPRRLVGRLLLAFLFVPLYCEMCLQAPGQGAVSWLRSAWHGALWPSAYTVLHAYVVVRVWVTSHWLLAGVLVVALAVAFVVLDRTLILLWHNHLVPRISGTHLRAGDGGTFPMTTVRLLDELDARPEDGTFVGVSPERRWGQTRYEPVYLDERLRATGVHVLGKTGSGKTASVIWPMVLQDIRDGKGVVVISGKGSDEEIRMVKALALAEGRQADVRIFALPAWDRPAIPTHSYNMVYVTPWSPAGRGGDPVAVAERVFSVLPMGDNVFYNQQAQIFFKNLMKALHGMPDPARPDHGLPFSLRDVAVCLKGVANDESAHGAGLELVLRETTHREAAVELRSQISGLGRDVRKVLSGLVGAVDQFLAPMVNAYAPDIIMEDVFQKRLILYVQLPANLYKIQAPALGKVFLQDIQQEGSLRQLDRTNRDQNPFAVFVDEFARFADLSVVEALSQLRDARLQYTLSHQSLADLKMVSAEFATSVWDNTRVKLVLNQDNPELCELIARSIGTRQGVQLTVRKDPGPYLTSLQSGVASSREVEEYKLHPNRIKNLARVGQAYLYSDDMLKPLCLGYIPSVSADYALPVRPQDSAAGLRLHEKVLARANAVEARQRDEDDDDDESRTT